MAELRTLGEALLLAQLAQSKGEKYDAAADFPSPVLGTEFVFSAAAITLLIARAQHLNEARASCAIDLPAYRPSRHQEPAAA